MAVNRLGELLVRNKLIDETQLAKALQEQKASGGRLGASLTKLGFLKEEDLAAFLSRQYGVPSINLNEFEIDESVIKLVPVDVVQKYQLIPVNRAGSTLIVAMADPSNIFAIDDIKFMTGYNVEVVVTSETSIRTAIDKYYDQSASFEPPMKLKNALTSRIKIMSEMDISERRLPQDGRIKIKLPGGKDMDYRVNCLPTLFGEKICLRLLDKSNLQLDMTKLGYEEQSLKWFKEQIHKPFGMVLVTGPTGSGKTVSLYSALSELNKPTENISTAEDPVEFNFAGINQVQMHEEIGLNFASALRAFLRQDPDIIMIG
ncbi:MAG: ATPase, T2SS/T4P/T4SS family, partial [Desulfuromonadales bacterium]